MIEQISQAMSNYVNVIEELENKRLLSIEDLGKFQQARQSLTAINAGLKTIPNNSLAYQHLSSTAKSMSFETRLGSIRDMLTKAINSKLDNCLKEDKTAEFHKIINSVLATNDQELINNIANKIERMQQQAKEEFNKAPSQNPDIERAFKKKIDLLSNATSQINTGLKINEFIEHSQELNTLNRVINSNEDIDFVEADIDNLNKEFAELKAEYRSITSQPLSSSDSEKLQNAFNAANNSFVEIKNVLIERLNEDLITGIQKEDFEGINNILNELSKISDTKLLEQAIARFNGYHLQLREQIDKLANTAEHTPEQEITLMNKFSYIATARLLLIEQVNEITAQKQQAKQAPQDPAPEIHVNPSPKH